MKKFWKVTLAIFMLFVIGLSTAIYFASKKITPEEIRKIVLTQLQEVFPNGNISLGKVDYSVGLRATITVEDLAMSVDRPKSNKSQNLFNVKSIKLKVPLWSILVGSGTVNLDLMSPKLSYFEEGQGNNWNWAMEGKKPSSPSKTEEAKSTNTQDHNTKKNESKLVDILISRFKVNISFLNSEIDYRLKDKSKGSLELERFLVKNLNFITPTAFEISSKVDLSENMKQLLKMGILVIGEVDLSQIIDKNLVTTNFVLSLDDINFKNTIKLESIKNKLALNIDIKNNKLKGSLNTDLDSSTTIKTNFSMDGDDIVFSNIMSDISLSSFMGMIPSSSLDGVDISKAKIKLTGGFSKKKSKLTPEIDMVLSPGIKLVGDAVKGDVLANVSFKNKNLDIHVDSSLNGGAVTLKSKGHLDINKTTVLAMLGSDPWDIKFDVANFGITKDEIQKLLYGKSEESKSEASKSKEKEGLSFPPIPPSNIALNCKNFRIDKQILSCDGRFKLRVSDTKNASFKTEYFNIRYSKGVGRLIHNTTISNRNIQNNIDFRMTDLQLAGLEPFLPPELKLITGTFNGSVKGPVQLRGDEMQYNMAVDFTASNGEIKGINLSDKVNSVIANVPLLAKKLGNKKYEFDSNFEQFHLDGNFSQVVHNIKKLHFVGMDKKAEVKGHGTVYPAPSNKKGEIYLDVKDNTGKISGQLKNHVGTDILPVKLSGPGYNLSADYGYTIAKLGQGALKAQKAKVASKVKEKAQSEINKQLKGVGGKLFKEKKVDKLLKGLFGN